MNSKLLSRMEELREGKVRAESLGAWKKVKLRDVLHERKTYSQKGEGYPHVTLSTKGISPKTERYDRDHLVKDEEKAYKITHKGDICYNPANLKFGVICENTFGDAIFSPIYVTFEVKAKDTPVVDSTAIVTTIVIVVAVVGVSVFAIVFFSKKSKQSKSTKSNKTIKKD